MQHNLYAGLFIFPFRMEYNLLEDLEGFMLFTEKKIKLAQSKE